MENTVEKPIGQIVAEDYRTAQIFKDHKIDFCCNGDRSVREVADKNNVDEQVLLNEIASVQENKSAGNIDFESWPLDLLSDYIAKTHHRYVEKQTQVLQPYLDKICKVHGNHHPELFEIKELFDTTAGAMAAHMKKEELILFPFIGKIVQAQQGNGELEQPSFKTVENPVAMMMEDHDAEGERFRKIAKLSNDYTPPEDACNTYKVTFGLLEEFESDLHKHIHLENNVLFPKAIKLEKAMQN